MKKECEIIRDLFPSYIENLESKSTKQFIEEHIANCPECKTILNTVQKDKIDESKEISIGKDIEIKNIKKYRNKNIRVKVIIILLIILLIVCASILSKYVYTTNIILGSYDRIQELKNSNNIKIVVEEHQIAYGNKEDVKDLIIKTEWYCKDGKYKKKFSSNQSEKDTHCYYGKLNSSEYEYIDEENQVKKCTFNYTVTSEILFNMFVDIEFDARQKNIISKVGNMLNFDIRTEFYNEKECYVLKKSSDSSYKEIWIDKETMTKVRGIEEIFGKYYYENIYIVELNNVSDEDVTIPNKNQ